ncbi:MAG TPA: hypothetical protein DEH02_19380 [Bacteroidales bacterium]|nr:MAG: hypothetical protein A2X01_00550 [Bacteroidetes bacterium GWF2_35_48]HBX53226.1 hypothetical protein [Bacteroidales bacterium]
MKKLDNIEKTNPFKTPEAYFDKLSERALNSIKNDTEIKTIPFSKILFRAAAIIILVITSITVTYYFTNSEKEKESKTNIAEISNLENYLDEASIINKIAEDSVVANEYFENNFNDFQNDTTEYLVENMDYISLLAEL